MEAPGVELSISFGFCSLRIKKKEIGLKSLFFQNYRTQENHVNSAEITCEEAISTLRSASSVSGLLIVVSKDGCAGYPKRLLVTNGSKDLFAVDDIGCNEATDCRDCHTVDSGNQCCAFRIYDISVLRSYLLSSSFGSATGCIGNKHGGNYGFRCDRLIENYEFSRNLVLIDLSAFDYTAPDRV